MGRVARSKPRKARRSRSTSVRRRRSSSREVWRPCFDGDFGDDSSDRGRSRRATSEPPASAPDGSRRSPRVPQVPHVPHASSCILMHSHAFTAFISVRRDPWIEADARSRVGRRPDSGSTATVVLGPSIDVPRVPSPTSCRHSAGTRIASRGTPIPSRPRARPRARRTMAFRRPSGENTVTGSLSTDRDGEGTISSDAGYRDRQRCDSGTSTPMPGMESGRGHVDQSGVRRRMYRLRTRGNGGA